MDDKQNTVELTEHRAMLYLPENAVDIRVIAKVYHEGELIEVEGNYTMEQIREAFQKADDGYIDDDDRFVITEKGRAWLEENKNKLQ